jgi:hypothetical protein
MFWQSGIRLRPGVKTDRGGNAVPDWSPDAVDQLPVSRLSIQPTTSTEATDTTRTAVVSGWQLISEPGTAPDIVSSDRFEFDSITCEVVGEVARWPDSFGGVHHIEAVLKRVTG